MGGDKDEDVLTRLRSAYSGLSPQLRRGARYLLDQPDDAALRSMRRVAAAAGVQPATMVRLAKRLGCSGYDELRDAFRDRLRGAGPAYGDRARRIQSRTSGQRRSGGLAALAAEMIHADQENLEASLALNGAEKLAAAAACLAGARRLYLVGSRSLYPAAFYVHYACRMFRADAVLLDGRGGTFADDLRGIGGRDAMLVFSLSPYTRGVVQATSYGAAHDAQVVVVTDSTVSPVATLGQHVLIVASRGPALFRSIVPSMAVAQTLAALMLAQGGARALAAVAEAEEQLALFSAYWPEEKPLSRGGGA
ncbi:MAG: MurR/RpiR family transcriptional regulator [Alphaproteobacteria bacterium]